MDLNKIIKIEKGGSTTTLPPIQPSTPKILIQKIVLPTIVKDINYSIGNAISGTITKIEKLEIPVKHSPVIVFGEGVYKKIAELKSILDTLHHIAYSGDYNDLINKPEIKDFTRDLENINVLLQCLTNDFNLHKDTINSNVNSIESVIATIESELSLLDNTIISTKEYLENLVNTYNTALTTTVSELRSDLETVKRLIQENATKIEYSILLLELAAELLQLTIQLLDNALKEVLSSIKSTGEDVKRFESTLQIVQNNVLEIQTDLQEADSNIVGITKDIQNLLNDLQATNKTIQTNTEQHLLAIDILGNNIEKLLPLIYAGL